MIAGQIRALTGGRVSVRLKRERAWASITFSGMRYCFSIESAEAAHASALLELARTLPDHEFSIPGYFIADIMITDRAELRLLVEVLAINDPVETLPGS